MRTLRLFRLHLLMALHFTVFFSAWLWRGHDGYAFLSGGSAVALWFMLSITVDQMRKDLPVHMSLYTHCVDHHDLRPGTAMTTQELVRWHSIDHTVVKTHPVERF